ncbi:MAG: XRE family transcriptional regulator [Sphingobacteriales bacterium]|nr:MAG: XRE family transcriptional regulator [Sphingobacteriales bacterium]
MNKPTKRTYFKDEALLIKIGNKIREIRQSRNISQEKLANECGIDYSQVHRMEMGKVNFSVSFLSKLSAALEVEITDFLS